MEYYEEATRVSEDPVIRASAMVEMAAIMWYAGEVKRPLGLLDRALVEVADHDEALMVRAETMRTAFTAYVPSLFGARDPSAADAGTGDERPPGHAPAGDAVGRLGIDARRTQGGVRALVELGWDEGRYLAEGDSIELLPQGISALVHARSSIVQLRSSPQCAPRVERAGR